MNDFNDLVFAPKSLMVICTESGNNGQSETLGEGEKKNYVFNFGYVEFETSLKYPGGDVK